MAVRAVTMLKHLHTTKKTLGLVLNLVEPFEVEDALCKLSSAPSSSLGILKFIPALSQTP